MPTEQDYDMIFLRVTDPLLQAHPKTIAEAYRLGSQARRALRLLREDMTLGITNIWRSGYKKLKDENDQMQRDLKSSYQDHDKMIDALIGDLIKALKK